VFEELVSYMSARKFSVKEFWTLEIPDIPMDDFPEVAKPGSSFKLYKNSCRGKGNFDAVEKSQICDLKGLKV